MDNDEEATVADVGKFIPVAELATWFKVMQKAFPEVFKAEETLFGTCKDRHPMGQELMCYFDGDPS